MPNYTNIVQLWDEMHAHLYKHGHTIICADSAAERLIGWMTFREHTHEDESEDAVLWTIPLTSAGIRPERCPENHPIRNFWPLNGQNRRALAEWMNRAPPWKSPAPPPEPEPPTFWERLLDG